MQNNKKTPYDDDFFASHADGSYRSAKSVLPFVQGIVNPKTIVDIGCGTGTWLRAWNDLGVNEVVGIDGNYVNNLDLQISQDRFFSMDLTKPAAVLGAPFELAQSLEVAEHLPESAAAGFVRFLCSLSPVVLFSAAIPFQGGTAHLNEQWPEYWSSIFSKNGYSVYDILRPKLWSLPDVEFYYAQNIFLFVKKDVSLSYELIRSRNSNDDEPLSRVHPRIWTDRLSSTPSLESLLASLPRSTTHFLTRVARRVKRKAFARGRPEPA